MNLWMQIIVITALTGSALMAGLFFVFSVTVMKAFSEIPSQEAIRAMRAINRVILNPLFLGIFMGTTVLSFIIGVLAIIGIEGLNTYEFITAAALYVFGTFFITASKNVPLNKQLDMVSDDESFTFWQHYLDKWTQYNHSRTVASTLAVIFYAIGLLQF